MRSDARALKGSLAARLCALGASALPAIAAQACTTPEPSSASAAARTAAAPPTSDVERFLPLENGHVLSFKTSASGSAETGLLILQVERRSPEHASLRSGKDSKLVEFVPDGVRLLTGGYLLKAPLAAGAEWAGPAGRVRVTAVDKEVRVAAGHFLGCVETTELDVGVGRSIVTTYCPDVGIATFSVAQGGREQRFELMSFGPRVDVNAL
jgi:hypothetical protein